MKKPFLYFVALFFLFAFCAEEAEEAAENSESQTENNAQTEDFDLHPDSAELTEDSAIEEEKHAKFDFTFSGKPYEICYIKNGTLYFYDTGTGSKLEFPEKQNVMHVFYHYSKNYMFYTVSKENTVWLKQAIFNNSKCETNFLTVLEQPAEKFTTDTYGELSRIFYRNDSVFVEYNYVWMEGFHDMFVFDLVNEKIRSEKNKIYSVMSPLREAQEKKTASVLEQIIPKEADNTVELYLQTESDTVKLTHTQHLDEEILANDDYYEEIDAESKFFSNVNISPDLTKLYFMIMTGMGDLAHGPLFIVNLDGTNQKEIKSDAMSSEFDPLWLNGSNLLFLREDDTDAQPAGLYITVGKSNRMVFIDSEVSFYTKRK